MISLKLEKVSKRFDNVQALDAIDLEIAAGELFFLLGPSGCGKTTLLRSLAGFCEPDSGKIFFGSEDVSHLPPHRRGTGMVFQSYALWPHMSVIENVAFGLVERGLAASEVKERAHEALDQVQMSGYGDRHISQLSGGQQQRVALARALVIRPRCLLLDEPLSNLDAKLRLEMRGEIRRLCKAHGLTAVYVTHDQKEALSVGDRIAVLDRGKIAQVGTPREVYRRPISCCVADFIGETNLIKGEIQSVKGTRAQVKTSLGLFEGEITRHDWTPDLGAAVTLSIRPEAWRLSAQGGTVNSIQGVFESIIYLGDAAQYTFKTSGGDIIISETNPRALRDSFSQGTHAVVDADDVVVLKD